MQIPHKFADITAEWLTEALQERCPGVRVTSCTLSDVKQTKHNKLRASIECVPASRGAELPRSLVIKGSFRGENPYNDPSKPDGGLNFGNWAETMSYVDVIPLLQVEHAQCFAARWDEERKSSFIVMEDLTLRKVHFLSAFDTLTYPQAARFIDSLARMHAAYWNSAEFDQPGRFVGIAERTRALKQMFEHSFVRLGSADAQEKASIGAATLVSQDHLLPRVLNDKRRRLLAMERMFEVNDTFGRCVVMGDEHLGNLYLDAGGRPGYLDWCARIEGWPLAVAYFLVNCLDAVDRRKWERPLLGHYLTQLGVYGTQAPTLEVAWHGYRCAALFAFLVWVNNRGAWQPAEINSGCTVRAAAAVLDLDSYEAVGV